MKTSIKARTLTQLSAAALIATALAGCAGTVKQESTGEYVDDSVITTKVKTVILNEKFMNGFAVNVETFKGIVQLSGFVKTQADHDKAVALARSVKGVTQVKDDIIVR